MNWKFFLLPLGLLAQPACAQKPKLNLRLRHQLDSLDRAYRRYEQRSDAAFEQNQADSLLQPIYLPNGALAGYKPKTATGPVRWEMPPDSSDLHFVTALIRRYGYPGKSLVGRPASEIVWQVLQRTGHTTRFLPQLRVAAETGEIEVVELSRRELSANFPTSWKKPLRGCVSSWTKNYAKAENKKNRPWTSSAGSSA